MLEIINKIKINIFKNRGLIVVILLVLSLLIPSFFAPSYTEAVKKNDVLGVATKSQLQISIPTILITPTPTISIPTATPTPTSIIASPTPTITPTPTLVPTATPTPTSNSTATPPTPTPTSILTPTATPMPTGLTVQIGVDYAGQKNADSYSVTVDQGQSAWDAVVKAIGINNLQYTDYGGNMGIFITSFSFVV